MDKIEIVKAYYAALDAAKVDQAGQYLSEEYQLVDFTPRPLDKNGVLQMTLLFKKALPNLQHSLSNARVEGNVVKITVQLSGTNTENLDLREMGIGVVPRSKRFVIFPNETYEFTVVHDEITLQRDVSPVSPNRRMSGRLKALGVNIAAL